MSARSGKTVFLPAIAIGSVYLGAVAGVYDLLGRALGPGKPTFRYLAAFSATQFLAIAVILFGLLASKLREQSRRRWTALWEPQIRALLAEQSGGSERMPELRHVYRRRARIIEMCLVEMMGSTRGETRRRLVLAAQELGIFRRWCERSRHRLVRARREAIARLALSRSREAVAYLEGALADRDAEVRLLAARALGAGSESAAGRMFRYALAEPLLVRALLAEDLKPHAQWLCREILPTLQGTDQWRAGLEMASAWRLSVPIPGLEEMIETGTAEIATMALRLLPYSAGPAAQEHGVLTGLSHPAAAVRTAAAAVAGRLELAAALPILAAGLGDPDRDAARACAMALGRLGPAAWPVLEAEVLRGSARAAIALESLEFAQTGRVESMKG